MTKLADYIAELILSQFEKRKPEKLPEGIKLEELETIALKHHMSVLILGALLQLDLPADKKAFYMGNVVQHIYISATQVKEAKDIEKILEENKVINQPMKGIILKNDYPIPEMREMSDIDILINDNDMEVVGELLTDNGYILKSREVHHDIYRKLPYIILELHRALYDKHVDKGQYEYFKTFERTEKKKDCEYTVQFSLEDFYIYMIAHMAKHFYARGCGIRNLVDIYVFRKKHGTELNQKYVDEQLQKNGLYVFTRKMEHLSRVWLDKDYTEEGPLDSDLFMYMLDCGIYGKDDYGFWNKYAKEADKDRGEVSNKNLKKHLRKWYYFPPMYYMADYYPWLNGRKYLLPWAWFIRGINGLCGKKGMTRRKLLKSVAPIEIRKIQNIYHEMELDFKN